MTKETDNARLIYEFCRATYEKCSTRGESSEQIFFCATKDKTLEGLVSIRLFYYFWRVT